VRKRRLPMLPDFSVSLPDKTREGFESVTLFSDRSAQMISCVLLSTARCIAIYDGVLCRVFDFPFAFTKDLQPGGINHQMRDFTSGERFETDINRLCALADTGVIRQRNGTFISVKMESIKPCAAQGQPEHAFNDQNGGDGEIRIALRSSP
jgi:hypothetical protein